MSWTRSSHQKSLKPVRRVRVALCVSHCEDCGCELPVTHQAVQLGTRCYPCWLGMSRFFVDGSSFDASLASQ